MKLNYSIGLIAYDGFLPRHEMGPLNFFLKKQIDRVSI
jgi:hypothetical protein